jgi:hypothetical protein
MHTFTFIPKHGIVTSIQAATVIEACTVYHDLGYTLDSPGLRIVKDGEEYSGNSDDSDLVLT